MTIHAKNFIAGEWIAVEGRTQDLNPSNTNDVVGEYPRASAADAEKAIAAAQAAFPAWSRSSIQERHDILKRIGDEIIARKDELGKLLSREEGKTLPEGVGETVRAGQIFQFFAGECLRLAGEKIPSIRPGVDVEITREPLGVVGLITPWNFPIAIPAWKIAPALAYGNCVVFKPADLVPGSAHALSEIIAQAGHPGRRVQSRHGPRLGGRRGDAEEQGHHRDLLHRLGCDRPQGRGDLRRLRSDEESAARDGRQESDGRARRRRPEDGGGMRRQRRVLLDRPALHGVLAPDRDQGHPRQLRRCAGGAHEDAW